MEQERCKKCNGNLYLEPFCQRCEGKLRERIAELQSENKRLNESYAELGESKLAEIGCANEQYAELEAQLAEIKNRIKGDCQYCVHFDGENFEGGWDCHLPYEKCQDPASGDSYHRKWEYKAKDGE